MADRAGIPGAPPPSGTVTFLFSDIEGSTRRWDRDRAAMQDAVRSHDAMMRTAIAVAGGHVFKTVGDAFCAAFTTPESAVAAALDAQRTLGAADFTAVDGLRVRMAIHTGTADERDGDYFGPAVNRVARLLAIGHGGQVLLSSVAASLVRENAPPLTTLADLGAHPLKDLEREEHVYQLVAPGLQRDFPGLRSHRMLSTNLPAEASSFVGRVDETAEVSALVGTHRLVTIVGPGGIGKTRLALHVASTVLEAWHDGAWFVELGPISDGALIPSAIAVALGLQVQAEGDALVALIAALGRKRLLLVLDNCEHVLEAAGGVAAAVLRTCPHVSLVATSRQPLGIGGEAVFRMPALDLPPEEQSDTLTAARGRAYDAIALFVARAEAADSRFHFSDEMAPFIARITRRLDGIPLAIELAAARLRLLGARGLQERLDHRFRLLVGGARDAVARQQTLQAAIDWSYELLTDRERRLFRRCGVFVSGFTARTAGFVAAEGELDDDDTFEVLCSLEDKSLIVAVAEVHGARFRLLETMRAYALERMDEHGERERIAERHLAYYRALAERAESDFMAKGSEAAYTMALAPEVGDVRAALTWSLSGGDLVAGAALATAIGRPWGRLGLSAEGIARIEAFIAATPDSDVRLRARLWTMLAWLAGGALHSTRAYEAATEAVRLARLAGDVPTLAWSLAYFALVAARLRRFDEAEAALDEARAAVGSAATTGQRLTELEVRAFLALLRKDLAVAASAYASQLALLRSIGDDYGAATAAAAYAEAEHARGETRHAIELVGSVLPFIAQHGREQHALILGNLAGYHLALDQPAEARLALETSIALLEKAEATSAFVIIALEHTALALALEGETERAARLEGYCDAALRAIGYERETTEDITHRRLATLLREHLSEEQIARLAAEGVALRPERAIDEARQKPATGLAPR
jgi:predicted ATPase/class 3 adenylate cyclase